MNNQIPRVIDPADVCVGDLIEVTSTEHPDSKIIDRVKERLGTAIRCQWSYWTGEPDGKTTFRLLDRPEPPKPAPPTEVGSVVLVEDVAYYWGDPEQAWLSTDPDRLDLTPQTMASKAWTLAKVVPADDPTAPKADDGLRERVENMAEDYRHSDTPYIPASEVFHRLRSILKERETK